MYFMETVALDAWLCCRNLEKVFYVSDLDKKNFFFNLWIL
jgi:hypothetical protein